MVNAVSPLTTQSALTKKRLLDFTVYLVVRLLVCVIQALSWSAALGLARGLAWLAVRLNRRHRRVAEDNLRQAFPHLGPVDVRRLVVATYEHLFVLVVEIIRLPRALQPGNVAEFVRYARPDDYDRVISWLN